MKGDRLVPIPGVGHHPTGSPTQNLTADTVPERFADGAVEAEVHREEDGLCHIGDDYSDLVALESGVRLGDDVVHKEAEHGRGADEDKVEEHD